MARNVSVNAEGASQMQTTSLFRETRLMHTKEVVHSPTGIGRGRDRGRDIGLCLIKVNQRQRQRHRTLPNKGKPMNYCVCDKQISLYSNKNK